MTFTPLKKIVNYILSVSEFHILNSWRQEDQNTHECKREKPHQLTIEAEADEIKEQRCSCTARSTGYCSHVVGLIHTLDLWRAQDEMSTTSLPQQWHKPRGKKIDAKPITAVVVEKENVSWKRRPV
ncbi:hypothetical protein J4Q44_G00384520 [Coregonus suidteri]|uniref:SWIM-type domain-containing protein n=1 Tax=Coregonus suidteri TaxID=861788 RepID=A0AAN8Q9A9_9TELE